MARAPLQLNATAENPNGLVMNIGATYEREVAASLERVWENVYDWEHLPWLHSDSFSSIELQAAAPWGWRARIGSRGAAESVVELVTDKPNSRYVSRTLEGPLPGLEIWTDLKVLDDHRTGISVAFHIPHVAKDRARQIGEMIAATYVNLWDEDEAMMQKRQRALDAERISAEPLSLGTLDAVKGRAPFTVVYGGEPIRIVCVDGDVVVFNARCPHLLGPLDENPVENGCVICPWHGYRFDVRTGRSADKRGLRLRNCPQPTIDKLTQMVVLGR